jgi:hypothetical protein
VLATSCRSISRSKYLESSLLSLSLDSDPYAFIQRHNQLAYMHTQSGNKEYALDHLAKAGAYVKRMMEYVQEQIDKEESK